MSLQAEKSSALRRWEKGKERGCWIQAALNSSAGSIAYKLHDLREVTQSLRWSLFPSSKRHCQPLLHRVVVAEA